MAVYFFLHSVLYAFAIYCTAEKIIEKLQGGIIDDVLQEIIKYVAAQSGDKLAVASIRRSLGYLLSIAGLYIVKEIGDCVEVEEIKGYAVEKIREYVVAPVRDNVVAPILRKLGYLLFYKSNIKDFRTQKENLKNTRDKVQGLVDDAEREGQVVLPNVREWLASVNKILEESTNFFEDGLQLNLKLCYQQSRNAKEKAAFFDGLIQKVGGFYRLSTSAVPFESRKLIFEDIMKALKDDGMNLIGIYGMPGVGKTTLAKEVMQQAKDDDLFDAAVMAVVSQSPDFTKIRGEVAEARRAALDSTKEKKGEAPDSTKEKKGILIILDDIWERVELEDIGICFGMKHKGDKVVLTSRRRELCDQMKTKKNFPIEVVTRGEGWDLFLKTAGDSVESSDLGPLAVQIVEECAGLPLAIVTIARALNNKGLPFWRVALEKLRKSTQEGKVLSSIELSYNYLESEEIKSIFLLCSLFPEDCDIPIQYLIIYGIGLRWFNDVNTVLDKARDKAHVLAHSLKSACLLQDGSNEDHVKMHDIIRDVAISIANKDKPKFLVRAGASWKDLPEEETFKWYTAISLISNNIHELPEGLECPKLHFLYLECPDLSLHFPDNFFVRMENLRVLNMSRMRFLSLPSSLRYLKNLRTLCFGHCSLEDISIITDLSKLEILSFIGSDIKELPKEIGMLTQLKLLDLTSCQELTVIPPNIIPNLSRLEGLYMDCSFLNWEIERQDKGGRNASLAELKYLSNLIILEIQIPHADHFPDDLLFKSLSSFKISVGTTFAPRKERYSYSKTLKLELNVSTALKTGVKVLLKKVEHFHLLGKMKGTVYDLDREGFRDLRSLIVQECSEVEYIFNAAECSKLQELRLCGLPRLINPWKDPAQHICLPKLTVVKVEDCDGLKNLFSHFVAKGLSKLVELEVRKCRMMEEIVGNEKEAASAAVNDIVFPHLRSLKLGDLPNLINFCSKMKGDLDTHTQQPLFDKKVFPQLKVLNVEGCHKVSKVVPFNLLLSLEELHVEECDSLEEVVEVEGLVVEEGHVNETLSQLKTLKLWFLPKLKHIMRCDKYPHRILGFKNLSSIDIYQCNSLKSLFSPSIANCLVQLKEVEIDSCEMMESIIAEEKEGEENCKEIVFPQLHTLKLENLPKLIGFMKTFTSIISIQQELMTDDEIVKEAPQEGNLCDPIQPLFNEKVAFPVLETLQIKNIGNLIEIGIRKLSVESFSQLKVLKLKGHVSETPFQLRGLPKLKHIMWWDMYPHGTLGFQNLSSIHVYGCNSLTSLFSPSIASNLVQLQELEIDSCKMMESIIAEERQGEDCIKSVEFPQLSTLQLKNLPKLISFMQTFTSKVATQEGNLGDPTKPLFDQKVLFAQLKVLKVEGCHKVSKVVQFNMILSLEELNVEDCDSLEEVVEVEVEVEGLVVETLHQLRELKLRELPKLKHIMRCAKYPHRILGFRNLSSIDIYQCNSLKSLFSRSIANCLVQLKEVEIDSCEMMESIITEEREGEENWKEIVFPQLRTLKLLNLPKLISFMKTIQQKLRIKDEIVKEAPQEGNLPDPIQPLFDEKVAFPVLETLQIINIGNLIEIWLSQLSVEYFSQLKVLEVEDCHKVSKIVAFNLLKWLPSLEELRVKNCDLVEEIIGVEGLVVEEGHVSETLSQLKKLKLRGLPKLKHIMRWDMYPHGTLGFQSIHIFECNSLTSLFSPTMASNLVQLEKLKIDSCKMMESIIAVEREGEDCIEIVEFPQLRTLELENLPKLISFRQTFTSNFSIRTTQEGNLIGDLIQPLFDKKVAFTNLVELRIVNIENLQEIFHTRLADESFSQLRLLEVTECHKLSSVAPSNLLPRLQNLEKLSVEGCNSMEKIFELEGEGRTPISLSQLEFVKLYYLPSLLMFCSGKYDFELPSLETLHLEKCPKMHTFSTGLKSTPNLETVEVEEDEEVWKGDLNSTIHHLFQEEEIKQCLYVIKDLVDGLHSREQDSSVQEDEEKDKDEEVGEKSEEANVEEQERKENISSQAVHHEISEEAEQEGHRKGSMEAIREHLKVMTNLLDELGVEEEEDDEEEGESEKAREANIEELQEEEEDDEEEGESEKAREAYIEELQEEEEDDEEEGESEKAREANIEELQEEEEDDEEEGESEKAREANIEELQEISEHLETLVVYRGGLHKPERVVVIRKHLKRMMDLVDRFGLREQELSIEKLKRDISSGNEVEEGEEGNASACRGIQRKILEIEVQAQL